MHAHRLHRCNVHDPRTPGQCHTRVTSADSSLPCFRLILFARLFTFRDAHAAGALDPDILIIEYPFERRFFIDIFNFSCSGKYAGQKCWNPQTFPDAYIQILLIVTHFRFRIAGTRFLEDLDCTKFNC